MNPTTQQLIEQFFIDLLGFEPELQIEENEEELLVQLNLDPNQSGVIIGYRGEVLTSIQLILGLMLQQHTQAWTPVRVNVNDYKQQRQSALENLAQNTARRVIESGQPMKLTHLSSYERRIIHTILADNPEVTTFSEGDSPVRVLVVAPHTM